MAKKLVLEIDMDAVENYEDKAYSILDSILSDLTFQMSHDGRSEGTITDKTINYGFHRSGEKVLAYFRTLEG